MSWDKLVERYKEHNNFMMEQIKEKNKELSELRKQNKQYREALKNIYELAKYDKYNNTLEQIVSEVEKALEESE